MRLLAQQALVLFLFAHAAWGAPPPVPASRPTTTMGPPRQFVLELAQPPLAQGSWTHAAFLADGRVISLDGVYDAALSKCIRRFDWSARFLSPSTHLAVSPDGAMLAVPRDGFRGAGNTEHWYGVSIVDLGNGRITRTPELAEITLAGAAFSAGGRTLAALAHDKVYALDAASSKQLAAPAHRAGIYQCALAPDAARFAKLRISFEEGRGKGDSATWQAAVVSLPGGKDLWTSKLQPGRAETLGFTQDGKRLCVNTWDEVHVFEPGQAAHVVQFTRQWQAALPAWTLKDRYLLLAARSGWDCALLDLHLNRVIPLEIPRGLGCRVVAVSPQGDQVVVNVLAPTATSVHVAQLRTERWCVTK